MSAPSRSKRAAAAKVKYTLDDDSEVDLLDESDFDPDE